MSDDADKAISGLLGGPLALGASRAMGDDDNDGDMDDDPRMSGARLLASELKSAMTGNDMDAIAKVLLEIRDL